MSKTQLVQRMLSSLSLINLKQLISGDIENWEDIFEAKFDYRKQVNIYGRYCEFP